MMRAIAAPALSFDFAEHGLFIYCWHFKIKFQICLFAHPAEDYIDPAYHDWVTATKGVLYIFCWKCVYKTLSPYIERDWYVSRRKKPALDRTRVILTTHCDVRWVLWNKYSTDILFHLIKFTLMKVHHILWWSLYEKKPTKTFFDCARSKHFELVNRNDWYWVRYIA